MDKPRKLSSSSTAGNHATSPSSSSDKSKTFELEEDVSKNMGERGNKEAIDNKTVSFSETTKHAGADTNSTIPSNNRNNFGFDIDAYYARFKDGPCPLSYRMGQCLMMLCEIDKKQVVLSDYGWCHYCHEAMHNHKVSEDADFDEEDCS